MKLIIIKTHGFSVHDGTQINLINEMNLAFTQASTHSAYVYDNDGKCVEAKTNRFQNGVHTMMENKP